MSTKAKSLTKLLIKELGPLSFAEFLRTARTSVDLSQVDMAKRLGLKRSTLCDIEKGRHLVSPALAAKIAKKCGLSQELAVKASLQDQITKADLRMSVDVRIM